MATNAQTNANRENAKKSTGPRTEEGKKTSSNNSVRHGFSGRLTFLNDDDALVYAELLRRYVKEMEPGDLIEEELIKTIADCNWQLNKIRAAEERATRRLFDELPGDDGDAPSRDLTESGSLERFARYAAHFHRALHQALKEFDRRKAARLQASRAAAIAAYEQRTRTIFDTKIDRMAIPNGFVLQNCAPYHFAAW